MLTPRNAADRHRLERRAECPNLSGRPVEPATQRLREGLWRDFILWLRANGLAETVVDPALACRFGPYGRELYQAGGPNSYYSETLNSLSARIARLRKVLQPAWDIAFSWQRQEPHQHDKAMPYQILLALITTALLWGWTRVAGFLALAWGGLCRPGEILAAARKDLVVPGDVANTVDYMLLEPKTRYRAARHQVARVDQCDEGHHHGLREPPAT